MTKTISTICKKKLWTSWHFQLSLFLICFDVHRFVDKKFSNLYSKLMSSQANFLVCKLVRLGITFSGRFRIPSTHMTHSHDPAHVSYLALSPQSRHEVCCPPSSAKSWYNLWMNRTRSDGHNTVSLLFDSAPPIGWANRRLLFRFDNDDEFHWWMKWMCSFYGVSLKKTGFRIRSREALTFGHRYRMAKF